MSKHGTGIEWTHVPNYKGETWNPVVGCSVVSPGCTNCYAMSMANRITRMQPNSHYHGTIKTVNEKPVWTGEIKSAPNHIWEKPLRWAKPRAIFVNSMGDLFHEGVTDDLIDRVFAYAALCEQHIFIILTKRAARMREYFDNMPRHNIPSNKVWLGVSVESQDQTIRLLDLEKTPAAVKLVSVEPMLSHVDLTPHMDWLSWVVCGGESGQDRRPFDMAWGRSLRDQCAAANTAFFMKQIDKKIPVPDDLQVRQWPTTTL